MAKQTKKRAPRKRSTSRRTGSRTKKTSSHLLWKSIALFLGLFLFASGGYFYGYEAGKQEHLLALNAEKQHSYELKSALQKLQTASHEYEKAPPKPHKREEKKPVAEPVKKEMVSAKPMLAIIIDDVSFGHDVRNIKALEMPLNMSFLPPSERHPHSAELAAKEASYMVHLPLQAMAFGSEEPDTLHVGDSAEKIDDRVRQIRDLFPRVRFVNNHTGSRFTADRTSMERLIEALDREGITFIDSRTTGKTVLPDLMESLHRPYIGRDVFLDHDPDVASVKKQIRKAVAIAKKYGSAIAIGHPHKKTLQALSESRGLLETVQLVDIETMVAYQQR